MPNVMLKGNIAKIVFITVGFTVLAIFAALLYRIKVHAKWQLPCKTYA